MHVTSADTVLQLPREVAHAPVRVVIGLAPYHALLTAVYSHLQSFCGYPYSSLFYLVLLPFAVGGFSFSLPLLSSRLRSLTHCFTSFPRTLETSCGHAFLPYAPFWSGPHPPRPSGILRCVFHTLTGVTVSARPPFCPPSRTWLIVCAAAPSVTAPPL